MSLQLLSLKETGLRLIANHPKGSNKSSLGGFATSDKSVFDSSGSLSIDINGVLKITRTSASPIMVNQKPVGHLSLAGNVSATLLDSGNFVIREVRPGRVSGRVLWQSFDHPTNVLLPGMKIGFNLKTKKEVAFTSWISDQVPASGAFRLGLDPSGANQLLVWRHGEIYWSSGILTTTEALS